MTAKSRNIRFNRILAWRKRRAKDRLVFSEELMEMISVEMDMVDETRDEREESLRRCLEKLPELHQQLIYLFYDKRQSLAEISIEVKKTRSATQRMLSRIRKILYDCVTRSSSEK